MDLSLEMFSTELLLKIFQYLDIVDLCRLKQTCKRFHAIIEEWGNALNKNLEPVLVTNQINKTVRQRSFRILSSFDRVRVSKNWEMGRYKERTEFNSIIRYIPCLQLENDLLWISRGCDIKAFKRHHKGIHPEKVIYKISGTSRADVCHFVKKNNYILAGQTNGSLFMWSFKDYKNIIDIQEYHQTDIDCVDLCGDVVVTGSKDNTVKIATIPHLHLNNPSQEIDLLDRVWSVSILPQNKAFTAIGTAGRTCGLNIYDSNHDVIFAKLNPVTYNQDTGVLDIKWESPSIIWSAGFDTKVRKWDLRTETCVQSLPDPFNATVYCFQYDNLNTVVTGTNAHGRVVLWDTRRPDYVQMYFMKSCRPAGRSSPIYSLSYDAEFLFTATDRHFNILSFSQSSGRPRDYSTLYANLYNRF